MNKSENIQDLAKALCAVQKELQPAKKEGYNPHFKSHFADLNSVWNSCRELLTKNGLSVAQVNGLGLENTVIIETVLLHESGQWISGELALPLAKHDPQGVGSAITYGRRYALASMLGIVSDDDDDGNAASRNGQVKAEKPSAGSNTSIGDIATAAQIGLLKNRAMKAKVDLDTLIGDEFPDANGVADLSKDAANFLISKLEAQI